MRLDKIEFRGLTRFRQSKPIAIDFRSFGDATLIALVGDNGAGKSTILETVPVALYKGFPSKPASLYHYCYGRDCFVDVTCTDEAGHVINIRLAIDAPASKTESYIFEDGRNLTNGKAAEFAKVVAERFGSESLFLATVFATSKKVGSFVEMERAERKALFIEMLRLKYLDELRVRAGKHLASEDDLLRTARDRARHIEADTRDSNGPLLPQLLDLRSVTSVNAETLQDAISDCRLRESRLSEEIAERQQSVRDLASLTELKSAAERSHLEAERNLTSLQIQLESSRTTFESQIRSTQTRLAAINLQAIATRQVATFEALDRRRRDAEDLVARLPEVKQAENETAVLTAAAENYQKALSDHASSELAIQSLDLRSEQARAHAQAEIESLQSKIQKQTELRRILAESPEIDAARRKAAELRDEEKVLTLAESELNSLRLRVSHARNTLQGLGAQVSIARQKQAHTRSSLEQRASQMNDGRCAGSPQWYPATPVLPRMRDAVGEELAPELVAQVLGESVPIVALSDECLLLKSAREAQAALTVFDSKDDPQVREAEKPWTKAAADLRPVEQQLVIEEAASSLRVARLKEIRLDLTTLDQKAARWTMMTQAQAQLFKLVRECGNEVAIQAEIETLQQRAEADHSLERFALSERSREVIELKQQAEEVLQSALVNTRKMVSASVGTVHSDPNRCHGLTLISMAQTAIKILLGVAAQRPMISHAQKQLVTLAQERTAEEERFASETRSAIQVREELSLEIERLNSEKAAAATALEAQCGQASSAVMDAQEHAIEAIAAYESALELAGPERLEALKQQLSRLQIARETSEGLLAKCHSAIIQLDRDIEHCESKLRELESAWESIQAIEKKMQVWQLLETALGPNGAQALEIDAARPAVEEIANRLLLASYGSRFRLEFDTQREKKKSPGEFSEVFDIVIWDEGEKRTIEDLSTGEQIVVCEVLSLAISQFNNWKNKIKWKTLWRDETSGSLDPKNAQAYIQMLRQAREIGGYEQVLFVSHQQPVWERADVRLLVENGAVRTI